MQQLLLLLKIFFETKINLCIFLEKKDVHLNFNILINVLNKVDFFNPKA